MCGLSIILLFVHPTGRFDPEVLGRHVGESLVPFGSLSWLKNLAESYPVGGKLILFNILLAIFGLSYLIMDVTVSIRRLHDLDWTIGPPLLFVFLIVPFISYLVYQISKEAIGIWIGLMLCAWLIFAIWVGVFPGTKGSNRFR